MGETMANVITRTTSGVLGRSALWLGILAAVHYLVGFALLVWVWPGDVVVIGITTVLSYVLPVAGVVLGHIARRSEGPRTASTVGLALSYLCLVATVVPLIAEVVILWQR